MLTGKITTGKIMRCIHARNRILFFSESSNMFCVLLLVFSFSRSDSDDGTSNAHIVRTRLRTKIIGKLPMKSMYLETSRSRSVKKYQKAFGGRLRPDPLGWGACRAPRTPSWISGRGHTEISHVLPPPCKIWERGGRNV